MERKVYLRTDEWTIAYISEIDRDKYTELHRQTNGNGTLFLNPICKDMMWKQVLESNDTLTFSILNKDMIYCGSIEVQGFNSRTPELGIELLEDMRNRGICHQVLPAFARKYCAENNVDYYLIRISSENMHSMHVFEKMGAMRIQESISPYRYVMSAIQRATGHEESERIEELLKDKFGYQENEVIYEYKLLPENFWGNDRS